MNTKLILLKDIVKIIRGEIILDNINLEIIKGDFMTIIGTSGSGKSSLLYILGLLDKPSSGEVFFEGERIDFRNNKKISLLRNQKIGFVFQFHYLLPELNLLENVMVPMLKRGIPKDQSKEKAYQLLARLGLGGKEKRKIYEVSGGEMQRTAIARALANDPEILIADEPTGNLDSKNTEKVLEIFQEINALGKTVIVVTHDRDVASKAKKRIEMRDGKILS